MSCKYKSSKTPSLNKGLQVLPPPAITSYVDLGIDVSQSIDEMERIVISCWSETIAFVKKSKVLGLERLSCLGRPQRSEGPSRQCENMHLYLRDDAVGGRFRILIPWGQRAQGSSHMSVGHLEAVHIASVNPSKSIYVS